MVHANLAPRVISRTSDTLRCSPGKPAACTQRCCHLWSGRLGPKGIRATTHSASSCSRECPLLACTCTLSCGTGGLGSPPVLQVAQERQGNTWVPSEGPWARPTDWDPSDPSHITSCAPSLGLLLREGGVWGGGGPAPPHPHQLLKRALPLPCCRGRKLIEMR